MIMQFSRFGQQPGQAGLDGGNYWPGVILMGPHLYLGCCGPTFRTRAFRQSLFGQDIGISRQEKKSKPKGSAPAKSIMQLIMRFLKSLQRITVSSFFFNLVFHLYTRKVCLCQVVESPCSKNTRSFEACFLWQSPDESRGKHNVKSVSPMGKGSHENK